MIMLKLKKSLKKEITEILDQDKIYSISQLFLQDQLYFIPMEQSFTVGFNN